MLTSLGVRAARWARRTDPWTDVVGLARTLLALGSATTLLFSPTDILFRPVAGVARAPVCDGLRAADPFCLVPHDHLEVARWLCFAGLLLVASGWRPRFTGLLHFWIAFGIQGSATLIDGGDQVASILALLLVPVTLTDGRKWHWQAAERRPLEGWEPYRRVLALVALALVRLQVAGIYFHAGEGKMEAREWSDGTALYYWFSSPDFGAPPWLMHVLRPLILNGWGVTLLTWGIIVLELSLAAGLVVPKRRRAWLLAGGLALHVGIIFVHGLVSFGTIMCAALVLYLRPIERELGIAEGVRGWFARRSSAGRYGAWRKPAAALATTIGR